MRSLLTRRSFAPVVLLAALLAGCSTSAPATADKADIRKSLRPIVGTSLINAKGATSIDQDRIDDTAAAYASVESETAVAAAVNGFAWIAVSAAKALIPASAHATPACTSTLGSPSGSHARISASAASAG